MHLQKFEIEDAVFYSPAALKDNFKIFFAFSSRKGGFSKQPYHYLNLASHVGDEPFSVYLNRTKFLGLTGIKNLQPLISVNQVHGNIVFKADNEFIENIYLKEGLRKKLTIENSEGLVNYLKPEADADAIISSQSAAPIMTMGADCNLILIADLKLRITASVHAGWRGVLNEILLKTLDELRKNYNSKNSDLVLYLGPSIRYCCFNVSIDLFEIFYQKYGRELVFNVKKIKDSPKYFIDLPFLLKNAALKSGIRFNNIYDLGLCTCCSNDLFFSYRKEGKTGRQGAVAFIEK